MTSEIREDLPDICYYYVRKALFDRAANCIAKKYDAPEVGEAECFRENCLYVGNFSLHLPIKVLIFL